MHNKAEIDQVLQQKTDAREIPGVVAIAANSKDVIYQGAFGKRDLSKDAAMTSNSVIVGDNPQASRLVPESERFQDLAPMQSVFLFY